jgi:hypothetical protein
MRRLLHVLAERVRRQIADIPIPIELHPRPAIGNIVDDERFPEQRLGIERGICGWPPPQRNRRAHDLARLALHELRNLDAAGQQRRGEIRPERIAPRV